ncbi:hypothetical protein HLH36_00790 [Gluconacetobacter aggeris]|uniref:Aspartyl protease n=1 Tax=Gluconacetobacter aggeris TaxID=1286186 RepID=A0A7W4NXT0_9PROT|nr:retropepsin-like aspartic protease [Gluconacetobacter aggeris]MBB2166905.1 hypothetical protein [Gluconacetobacter aggeris]
MSAWRRAARSGFRPLPLLLAAMLPWPMMAAHGQPAAPPAGATDPPPPAPRNGRCIAHVLSLPLLTGEGSPGVPITLNAAEGMAFLSLSQEMLGVFERPGIGYDHGRSLQMKTVTGAGETRETVVDRLQLDRGSAHHVPAVILGQIGDRKVAGRPVLGVVGYDILGNYDVLIDFPGQTVTLFKETGAAACPPLPALVGAHAYTALLMPNPLGMDVTVQVAIDGAPVGMQVEPGSNASIVRAADAADIGVGQAALADDPRSRTEAGNAIIGHRHRFTHPVIGTWHGDSLAADVTDAQFNILGMDFFRGRRVLFAFPTRMLYFSDVQPGAGPPASAALSLAQSRLADVEVQEQDDTPPAPPPAAPPGP